MSENTKDEIITKLVDTLCKLISVKSVITIMLTFGMLFLLSGKWVVADAILTLYGTVYGATITYFFTKKPDGGEK